jgi:hypothetical protein
LWERVACGAIWVRIDAAYKAIARYKPSVISMRRTIPMRISRKDVFKFLAGAFFVTAGATLYLAWHHILVPFFGLALTPELSWLRGFVHFALFLLSFYFGFIKT